MTVVISDAQVRRYFSMSQCVSAVERGFGAAGRGGFDVTERKVVAVEGGARLLSLTAGSAALGRLVANVYTGAPSGGDKRLTSVNRRQKFYVVFDAATGACEAIVSGAHLSWLKTGAMGAVAIRHIAPESVRCLAILGSGRQARAALAGAVTVRDFDEIRVWSKTPGNAEKMVADFPGLPIAAVPRSAREAVNGAEVVVTATTATEPIIDAEWLVAGCHVNSIGAHYPNHRELDTETVRTSTVFVDTMVAARAEKGELLIAERDGAFSYDEVVGELGGLVAGTCDWTRSAGERTLFASCGSAIESMGAAVGVLEAIPDEDRQTVEL
ncbi:MAG TPA: ornithine cyclodeaminase family protein [Acidimicrobiia bacterium]|jgi:alanine dehydrogenase